MKKTSRKFLFERRSKSKLKPTIFFLLEIVAMFLIVYLLSLGSITIAGVFVFAVMMINPLRRFFRVLERTTFPLSRNGLNI